MLASVRDHNVFATHDVSGLWWIGLVWRSNCDDDNREVGVRYSDEGFGRIGIRARGYALVISQGAAFPVDEDDRDML